jgi:hypothetical protein
MERVRPGDFLYTPELGKLKVCGWHPLVPGALCVQNALGQHVTISNFASAAKLTTTSIGKLNRMVGSDDKSSSSD